MFLTPAQNAEAIYHGSVRISSNNSVRKQESIYVLHHLRCVLQLHLMRRANVRRDDVHIAESVGAPLE